MSFLLIAEEISAPGTLSGGLLVMVDDITTTNTWGKRKC